jgi:hypothetical protein
MRLTASILLILLLTGCASAPKTELPDPVVVTKYVRAECGEPPQRAFVNLRPIEWQIIEGRFTLSAEGYEDLGYNVSMILAGIRELQSEIEFYEKCLSSTPQKPEASDDSSE